MKVLVKSLLRHFGLEILRYKKDSLAKQISLKPRTTARGNALLSYVLAPFLLKPGQTISNDHTHDWESFQIAEILLDLGYAVDVIDYRNFIFRPRKPYSIFIGARTNFERIARLINPNCIKIVHLDTAHWIYNNSYAYNRHRELVERRGVALNNYKYVEVNQALEWADCATLHGNQYTQGTYRYAQKPLFPIPNTTCGLYDSPKNKEWDICRKNFLWFGSGGLVHKGLDLTLEAFAGMPDYHLHVCGPIEQEKKFEQIYTKELYHTPNIHTKGWVDINGEDFLEVINQCIGLIYPSSSEGCPGSVSTCMHAGLIPILTFECGMDVHDFGIILKNSSIAEIRKTIIGLSNLPIEKLEVMAQSTWEYARNTHTRENFAVEMRRALEKIIANDY